MENSTEKNKWVAIVYHNDEKVGSFHLNDEHRTFEEAEIVAQKWVDVRFKNHDWVLHKVV